MPFSLPRKSCTAATIVSTFIAQTPGQRHLANELASARGLAKQPRTPVSAMRRNIELKAKLADMDKARRIARQIATQHVGLLHQVDTYFHCPRGRLKLREIEGRPAELIWYGRADQSRSRASDYELVAIPDPRSAKAALAAGLGIRSVVEKKREVFLYQNVRIHLDDVVSLGSFIEFEAVLGPDHDEESGHEALRILSAQFSISPSDLLNSSYGDMLEG